jgi:(R,R)-butanediol dehydrogenase/meso-butanediol dehydrogenase/diacetyl reductase
MRAAIFDTPGEPLRIETVPEPEPGPGQLLVRVARCGICGTDLHVTQGSGYTASPGTILGHEFCGEVVGVGRDVDGFMAGDRVAAMPLSGCGACQHCLAGAPARCSSRVFVFGGYAECAVVSADTAARMPTSLSDADGALVEPLAVALHGLAMARIEPGANVLVQGAGPIGLSALFWARRFGAGAVDVVEGAPVRAAIAERMGANRVVAPPARDAEPGTAPELDREGQYDMVVECVGRPSLLMQALSQLKPGGTIVSLGFCFEPDQLIPAIAGGREARVLFPQLYSVSEFHYALDALHAGAVEPRHMVTRSTSLDELSGVFDSLRNNPAECKVLIDPTVPAA